MTLTDTLVRWADGLYQAFAAEVGADLLQGTFWEGERGHLRTARGSVPFEHHMQVDVPLPGLMFTRARSSYDNPDGFSFSLRRRTVFTRFMPAPPAGRLGEALGLSGFVVRSSDARRMAALLDDRRVRELLEAHGSIRLELRGSRGYDGRVHDPANELYFESVDAIASGRALERVRDLFVATLDRLAQQAPSRRPIDETPRLPAVEPARRREADRQQRRAAGHTVRIAAPPNAGSVRARRQELIATLEARLAQSRGALLKTLEARQPAPPASRPAAAPTRPLPAVPAAPRAAPAAAFHRSVPEPGPVAGPALVLLDDSSVPTGRSFTLARSPALIGRSIACEVSLDDPTLSYRQARLQRDGADWLLEDLTGSTSTEVNGQRLAGRRALTDGDEIRLGRTRLRFVKATLHPPPS